MKNTEFSAAAAAPIFKAHLGVLKAMKESSPGKYRVMIERIFQGARYVFFLFINVSYLLLAWT